MLKKGMIHISLRSVLAILLVLVLSLSAVSCRKSSDQKKKEKASQESSTGSKEDTQQVDEIMVEQLVDKAMKKLTLEQKIGQLFIVCTDSLDFDAETELTEAGAKQIEKYQPGGVIFFSFNLKEPKLAISTSSPLSKDSKIISNVKSTALFESLIDK